VGLVKLTMKSLPLMTVLVRLIALLARRSVCGVFGHIFRPVRFGVCRHCSRCGVDWSDVVPPTWDREIRASIRRNREALAK
jgi:hypothetical protein